jgi:PAS domain S-box-containing protein
VTSAPAVPRILLDAADVPVATLDPDGIITSLNPAFSRLCGRASAELVGTHVTSLAERDDHPLVLDAVIGILGRHGDLEQVEFQLDSVTGTSRRVRLALTGEVAPDDRVTSIVVVGRDLTADRRQSVAAHEPSESGASLAPALEPVLAAAGRDARLRDRPFALIELDVVDPELVVERSGPARARGATNLLVDRMRQQLRSHDTVVRISSSSVAVVATDLGDVQDAAGVCYRLLSTTMEPVLVQGHAVALTLAAGIAVDDGTSPVELLTATAAGLLSDASADGGGFRVLALGQLAQA